MLELSCPAVNVSQLLDVRMPAVVLNDPKMERRIRIDNHIVDQLKQVAETCIVPGPDVQALAREAMPNRKHINAHAHTPHSARNTPTCLIRPN